MNRWLHFGRWPSSHDLDLLLDADPEMRRTITRWAGQPDDGYRFLRPDELPIPEVLIQQAIDTAARHNPTPFVAYGRDALPIDAVLLRRRNRPSLVAWVPPPYTTWRLNWTPPIPDSFFDSARDLIVPQPLCHPGTVAHWGALENQNATPNR